MLSRTEASSLRWSGSTPTMAGRSLMAAWSGAITADAHESPPEYTRWRTNMASSVQVSVPSAEWSDGIGTS